MFAVIYHIQQYTLVQDFLWQGARVNCDHSWYFCCAYSRIAGLKFEILMVKTVLLLVYILCTSFGEAEIRFIMVKKMKVSHFTQ